MSIFDSISTVYKNIVSTVTKTADKLAAMGPGPSPIKTTTALKEGLKSATIATGIGTIAKVPAVAAGAATAATAITKAIGGTAKQAVIQSSPITKIGLAAGAVVAAGAVARQPAAAAKAVINIPSSLANFGGNVADLAVNPSLANLKKVGKEDPILSALTAAGVAFGVGKGVPALIASVANTSAIKESTAAAVSSNLPTLKEESALPKPSSSLLPATIGATSAVSPIPITPQTQVIGKSAGSSGVRRYKKIKSRPSNSQSVRVNIYNQSKVLNSRVFRSM